jgi:hypothetical protein
MREVRRDREIIRKVLFAFVFSFALMPLSLWGHDVHPRIWLDSETMTRLRALEGANDPTWIALKASADSYKTRIVEPFDRSACTGNDICYAYEGFGWLNSIAPLALVYKLTGDTSYSTQVKNILHVMIAAGVTPETIDSGYPSRTIVLALALAYDWCYDQLSPSDKRNLNALLDSYWTWLQANGFQWVCGVGCPTGYGNYYSGHILGFGLAALAMEGDDANAVEIQSSILASFNKYFVPAITIGDTTNWFNGARFGGAEAGGYAIESYNYGGATFVRFIQYMKAMQTAGKTDLFTSYLPWIKRVAQNTIYQIRPDLWAVTDEGTWSGDYERVFYHNIVYDLSGLLNGTTEGGWMAYLYNHLQPPPTADNVSMSTYAPTYLELFLYNMGQSAIDYTTTLPTAFFSLGDNHTIVRTDWTTSAVHTTFNGNTVGQDGDHQQRAGGHISIQRGPDYLLINAGQWHGTPDGVAGSGGASDQAGWQTNTLFYDDGGAACLGLNYQYAGCQMVWGVPNTVVHKEGVGYAFQKADLRPIYRNNKGITTIAAYYRSFVNIGGDISFVFDRISAPSTSTRQLYWHTPALNTAIIPGNVTNFTLNGGIASLTVGTSTLWINTLLPSSPTINRAQGSSAWGGTPDNTQHFVVSDSNANSCSTNCLFLTLLAPTASSVSAMPTTTLISTTGYKGAIYNDGILPRIALFSSDGTSKKQVTYTASYSGELNGRHVITDLIPGTYIVSKDDAIVLEGQAVRSDGSLSFVISGGTTYSIRYAGPLVEISPPTGLTIKVH